MNVSGAGSNHVSLVGTNGAVGGRDVFGCFELELRTSERGVIVLELVLIAVFSFNLFDGDWGSPGLGQGSDTLLGEVS